MKVSYMELIYGPMFSGKTSMLMAKIEKYNGLGDNVLVINHSNDTRTDESIETHNGTKYKAIKTHELLPLVKDERFINANVIAIDEVQFFEDLIPFIHKVEWLNKIFFFAGLKGDASRKPFKQISDLIPLTDLTIDVSAVDLSTPERLNAPFTRRKDNKSLSSQVAVGGKETYESLSRQSYLQKEMEQKIINDF